MVKFTELNCRRNVLTDKEIKKILKDSLPKNCKYKKNTNLILEGLLDSFAVIFLISNIEKKLKIKINLEKFNMKNFSSEEKIVSYLKKIKNNE